MTHNFCEDCGCVSDAPGVCTTEDCAKNGTPLMACDCESPESHEKADETSDSEAAASDTLVA